MVMTYDGAPDVLFNGSVEFENPIEDTFSGANVNAKLFFEQGSNNVSLQGSMDDVGIWNRPFRGGGCCPYYAGTPFLVV